MSGPECHLRPQPDVVLGPRSHFVIGLLDGYLAVNDYRLEGLLPLSVPVLKRHRPCLERCFERQTGEYCLECHPVELGLLDVAFHSVLADFERIVRKVGNHRFHDFRVLLGKRFDMHVHLYVVSGVNHKLIPHLGSRG